MSKKQLMNSRQTNTVVLVRLPFASIIEGGRPDYHLGLGYISSALQKNGYKVKLVDCETQSYAKVINKPSIANIIRKTLTPSKFRHDRLTELIKVTEQTDYFLWDRIAEEITRHEPFLIGFTCYTQNVELLKIITKKLKRINDKIPIVAGGVHPSSQPEMINECPDINYLVIGEGEITIVELCNYLYFKNGAISKIDGIVYRSNGVVNTTNRRKLCPDLDSLCFPDRSDSKEYRVQHQIITGRGCPGKCGFCASHLLWGRNVRRRSIENILLEFDILVNKYNAKRIRIVDDTFTNDLIFLTNFCRDFKKKTYCGKLHLSISSRVDTLNSEILDQLVKIGVDTISFGIESGSIVILNRIGKQINLEKVKLIISECCKRKIRCFCNFIIGHPEETSEDVMLSIDLIKEISNWSVECELNIASPYPGTDYWNIALRKGFVKDCFDYRSLFHQGAFSVNITSMSDKELENSYAMFCKAIAIHKVYHRAAIGIKRLLSIKP